MDQQVEACPDKVSPGATSALLIELHQAILQGHYNLANFSRVHVQRVHHATCRLRGCALRAWHVASSSRLREHFGEPWQPQHMYH